MAVIGTAPGGKLEARRHAQFAVEHRQLVSDGLHAGSEDGGDRTIGLALQDFADEFALTAREGPEDREFHSPMENVTPPGSAQATCGPAAETSLDLLARARAGDAEALNRLAARYLPRMRRWASGRLPQWTRDLSETDDLVQDAMLQTFGRLNRIDVEHEGALHAYLRQAIMNRIRDHFRRSGRRPAITAIETDHPAADVSPLEAAIGVETLERYERALASLSTDDQAAIIGRIELDYSNEELAVALNRPSPNAARMAVERALVRLANEMRREA